MPGLFNSSAHWPLHESVTELPELEGWVVRLVSISLEALVTPVHFCTHIRGGLRETLLSGREIQSRVNRET